MDPFEQLRQHIRDNYPSEAAFARAVPVSGAALSRYLNDKRTPTNKVRLRIFELSGIDLNPLPLPTEAA